MNLFSPPTDSLYKFFAISGLILFIYMGYLLFSPNSENDHLKLNREYYQINADLDNLKDELHFHSTYSIDSLKRLKIHDVVLEKITDSRLKSVVYNSSNSIKVKYQNIVKQYADWDVKWKYFNNNSSKFNENIYLSLLAIGEFIGLIGIYLWYVNIQKPTDDVNLQKKLSNEFFQEKCQSCDKRFFNYNERGTEQDGTVSKSYCMECFTSGSFVEPNLTFEEANNRLKTKLNDLNYSGIRARIRLKNFKYLLRWKREKIW